MVKLFKKQLFAWFKKPFPTIESVRDILLISLGSGGVVLGILLIIKPFGIESFKGIFFFLCGFALIDFVVTALHLFLFRKLFSMKKNPNWTTGNNFLFILWLLLAISFSNYFYGEHFVNQSYVPGLEYLNRTGIFSWISMTFSIGIIPVVFALYFIEKKFYMRNQLRAEQFSKDLKKPKRGKSEIQIELQLNKDTSFFIGSNNFICAKAEGGNYISVFWQEGLILKKEVFRLTLAGFLDKTNTSDNIVKCHKSYIINLNKVLSFHGNARAVTVCLSWIDFDVPVSRSFPREKLIKKG